MTEKNRYSVAPLGKQNRAASCCGVKELDSYFLERAPRDMREKLAAIFVLTADESPETILGYYTLSSLNIETGELPQELQKRTGRYAHVGATLIGRLAVTQQSQGKGFGEFLLVDALERALQNSRTVASFAVVVDAKDQNAASFYTRHGFLPLKGRRLFLPMRTVEQLFQP
jgi:GNAT superfamily N-acetyltransferase